MSDILPSRHPEVESCAPYLAGALDEDAEFAFERHLSTCDVCLAECDRLGPLVSTMIGLDPPRPG